MPFFLAGVALLLVLIFGARLLATANPQTLATVIRKTGGVAALAIAALFLVRGLVILAIPLAMFGLALIGLPVGSWYGGSGTLRRHVAQISRTKITQCAPKPSIWSSTTIAGAWKEPASRANSPAGHCRR